MGLLVDGEWEDKWYDTESTGGKFERDESAFRDWVRADGSSDFRAEPGRYHLYVSSACPWSHRAMIFRRLKDLEHVISMSITDPFMDENGWKFSHGPGCIPDTVNGAQFMHEIYTKAKSDYTGRVTVPVLWDKQKETIVNNESSEIIRMFNSEFDEFGDFTLDFYPEHLRDEIDEINPIVYDNVNNGVYKCGFATSQEAYEKAFVPLFDTLDMIEQKLSEQRYLAGDKITEADWRLFATLARFDPVYVYHFKCNLRRIADYHNLSNYLRELYQYPGIKETVDMNHIKQHYYRSHETINPNRIVPIGPEMDLNEPHDREKD